MSFIKFGVGKLVTGLTLVSALEGAVVVHNTYQSTILKRNKDLIEHNKVLVTQKAEPLTNTVIRESTGNKDFKVYNLKEYFDYFLWGSSSDANNSSKQETIKTIEPTISTEHDNDQSWLDWLLWGSKNNNAIIKKIVKVEDIALNPKVDIEVKSISWYDYLIDQAMYIHDRLEPILGSALYYVEIFVLMNVILAVLCIILLDVLIILTFLDLVKKVLVRIHNLLFKY